MYPDVLREQIDDLNKNLDNLNNQIKESSKTSNKLQKWLIAWTIVMAIAVGSQAVLIGIQIFS
jgi:prefoldin subunit 5